MEERIDTHIPGADKTKSVYLCDMGSVTKRSEECSDADWKTKTESWITSCLETLHNTCAGEDSDGKGGADE